MQTARPRTIVLVVRAHDDHVEAVKTVLATVRSGLVDPHLHSDTKLACDFAGPFEVSGVDVEVLNAMADDAAGFFTEEEYQRDPDIIRNRAMMAGIRALAAAAGA